MEYVKGKPYFCRVTNKIKQYPYVNKNLDCKLLIIGGGIDGAIANFYLSKKYDVVMVDKGRFGFSCTSCATALLEYQLDEYANDLFNYLSENDIVNIYNMGMESINKIEQFVNEYGNHCEFIKSPTFLYTSKTNSSKSVSLVITSYAITIIFRSSPIC